MDPLNFRNNAVSATPAESLLCISKEVPKFRNINPAH